MLSIQFSMFYLMLEYRLSFELMGTVAEGIPYWSGCVVTINQAHVLMFHNTKSANLAKCRIKQMLLVAKYRI